MVFASLILNCKARVRVTEWHACADLLRKFGDPDRNRTCINSLEGCCTIHYATRPDTKYHLPGTMRSMVGVSAKHHLRGTRRAGCKRCEFPQRVATRSITSSSTDLQRFSVCRGFRQHHHVLVALRHRLYCLLRQGILA